MSIQPIGECEDLSYPFEMTQTDRVVDQVKALASILMVPFWEAQACVQYCCLPILPGEYGQENTKIKEVAKRFLILPVSLFLMIPAIPLALMGQVLTGLARVYESENYRYLSGNASEKIEPSTKFFHLNCCMFPGGLPYSTGGFVPAEERFDALLKIVLEVAPDLLFLCEFNRLLSSPMYHALREEYAHFFVDIGLSEKGIENQLFVASKKPLTSPPRYIPFTMPIENEQKHMQKGFFALETEDCWYLYTHLQAKDDAHSREVRQQQLDVIQTFIEEETEDKPCILLGDLNINRLEEPNTDYQKMLERGFVDFFALQHPDVVTCTDAFAYHIKGIEREALSEVIDYILLYPKGKDIPLQTDDYDTTKGNPITDHHGLIGVI